jgi:signal transduction histidine kinase/ActR/RegA family two-component response regulator
VSTLKIFTHEQLAVFDLLERPVWVFDFEKLRIWWANQAALPFWQARSLEELLARDYREGLSAASVQRIAETVRRLEGGEPRVTEEWTFYPLGVPLPSRLSMSPIHIENGRLAFFCEAEALAPGRLDRTLLRGVEALRHLPVAVCEFDQSGQVVYQNPEALRVFGPSDGLLSLLPRRFADRVEGERILLEAARGEWIELQVPLATLAGSRWCHVTLGQSTDPVHGGPIILFTARDISEHRRDQERLQHAKDSAEIASRAKSAFLTTVTHELRTPLNGILGFGELLADTALDAQQQDYLQNMRASARSLLALIDDLLDLSRLEAGRLDISEQPLDLAAVTEEVVDVVSPRIRAKGLALLVHRADDVPRALRGDPQRLRQLLLHLLDNAIKLTHAGKISLRVERAPEQGRWREERTWIRLEIADTGAGLPPERIERIFDTFTQLDDASARASGGLGLGLAICRLLAERMGGTIGAESKPGAGSRFWVDLPLRLGGRARTPGFGDFGNTADAGGDGRSILVVEDNPVNQVLVRTVLRKLGHHATVAGNGLDALRALDDQDFDLILMDIQMPEMDGVEATRAIRARGLGPERLPIVALTANLNADSRIDYLHAGMNECIGKPFRVTDLAAVIERWTGPRAATGT